MKYLLTLIVFFIFLTKSYSQDDWDFEIGGNIVDVRNYTTDINTILKDYFGPTEWGENSSYPISRIAVQKYLGNKLSLQLVGSINSIKTIVSAYDTDAEYVSIDLILKRDLTKLFYSKKWFDPYLLFGLGHQTITTPEKSASDLVFIAGAGFTAWTFNSFGLNFQTSYKHGFNSGGRDVFQHSIGLVYNIQSNYSKTRKHSLNN